MAYASKASGLSPGKITAVTVLTVIGVIAIIVGVLYLAEPAKSLPSVLGTITHPAKRANSPRDLRGGIALAVGVILLAVAGFTGWKGRSASR
ncbi:MAG: hypothetical protein J2P25_20010 [Nocardiopsaceae bacterium]|nr:hypothetical protein [Nocardiopsaceae bacterium]